MALHLYLGRVKTDAAATVGSHDIATTIHTTGADIGKYCDVLGAGSGGETLVAVITGLGSNTVTLGYAATTAVTDATITIWDPYSAGRYSIDGEVGSLTNRPSLSFSGDLAKDPTVPRVGQPVLVIESDLAGTPPSVSIAGDVFGGSINDVELQAQGTDNALVTCQCVSWEALAAKRTTAQPNDGVDPINGKFSGEAAGAVFQYIADILDKDISKVQVVTGPTIPEISFDYTDCASAFDQTCTAASGDDTYIWRMDARRNLYFELQTTTAAPWGISDSDILIERSVTWTLEKYANVCFVTPKDSSGDTIDNALVEVYPNNPAIDERSAVEGGVGRAEIVVSAGDQNASMDAATLAESIAKTYAKIPQTYEYSVYRRGIAAGQLQHITDTVLGVDDDFLIDSVRVSTTNGTPVFQVHAVNGALIGDYKTALGNLGGGGTGFSGAVSGGGGGVVSTADTALTITVDTTLSTGPQIVKVDATSAAVTATLPSAATMIGQRKTLWKWDAAANNVTVDAAGSETIDGALSQTLTTQYQSITIEAISSTEWKIVSSAVAVTPVSPTAPGAFTIGTLSYEWIAVSKQGGEVPQRASDLITVTILVTPPGTMGTTKGGHIYIEIPDQSAGTTARMGTATMGGADVMQDEWAPIDKGKFPYLAGETWQLSLTLRISAATDIRIYVSSYSDQIDTPLVRAGSMGATPSAVLTVSPPVVRKPGSASNITPQMPPTPTASVLANVSVGGKLRTPIAVTLDFTSFPTTVDPDWGYQLFGYVNGNLDTDPVLVSGAMRFSGTYESYIVPAGPDGINVAHTFGPETPTSSTSVTIYAVAGLFGARVLHGRRSDEFIANNLIPGITPSVAVTYGTTAGVTDPTAFVAALLDTSVGVNNLVFGVLPLGIDNARLALLAVNTSQLAALAVTAAKLGNSSVTATAIANLAVGTAAIQTGAITTALIANAAITNALIASLAVGTANIQNAAVGTAQIANLAVTAALIANATITGAKIASATITDAHITALDVSKLTVTGIISVVGSTPGVVIQDSTNTLVQAKMSPAGVLCNGSTIGTLTVNLNGFSGGVLTLTNNPGTQSVQVDSINARVKINGTAVLLSQYPSVPTTLADVITIIRYHGLSA